MATNILIPFYSSYGHLHKMAHAVAEGAASVADTEVKVARIPELEAARQAHVRSRRLRSGARSDG